MKGQRAASQSAAPRIREINEKLRDLSAGILAVQNVFTDRRAYVNALTYSIETETSASSRKSKQADLEEYKKQGSTVEMPDGKKVNFEPGVARIKVRGEPHGAYKVMGDKTLKLLTVHVVDKDQPLMNRVEP